ncbi:MAG: hypothetical protein MK193_07945 [Lentisphaeria bacterium]|nr:hypothetical protein [Lentisphaeria bacterium]
MKSFLIFILVGLFSASAESPLTNFLDTPLKEGQDTVYSPSLQLVWDRLKEKAGGSIEMEDQPLLVNQLNDRKLADKYFPEGSILALAGEYRRSQVPKLEKSLKRKYGKDAPDLPKGLYKSGKNFVAFSYFSRDLSFIQTLDPFADKAMPFLTADGVKSVKAFGTQAATANIQIFDYQDKNHFTLYIKSNVKDEYFILSKIAKPATMQAAVEHAYQAVRQKRSAFTRFDIGDERVIYMNDIRDGDVFAIPFIQFDLSKNYEELLNKKILNEKFAGLGLKAASEQVKFELHEKGLSADAKAVEENHFAEASKPRKFVFNKPFLLSVWRKGAKEPYLAMWIETTNFMSSVAK